jgi:hypothetical protein
MLVDSNLIDEVQMRIALAEQQRTGRKFGSTLVNLQFIDENVLAAFLSKQIDVPCISLLNIDIPKKVLRRLPARLARDCSAIPIRIDGDRLEVAMVDPTDIELVDVLEKGTGMTVLPLIAPQSSIEKMIERIYPIHEAAPDDTLVSSPPVKAATTDPIFMDLIEEIENTDIDFRLERIERGVSEIWTLLEKVLRVIESRESVSDRFSSRK